MLEAFHRSGTDGAAGQHHQSEASSVHPCLAIISSRKHCLLNASVTWCTFAHELIGKPAIPEKQGAIPTEGRRDRPNEKQRLKGEDFREYVVRIHLRRDGIKCE
jgi:hypothetical protein